MNSLRTGGATRTPDTWFWRPVLYQLSYTRVFLRDANIVISSKIPKKIVKWSEGNMVKWLDGYMVNFAGLFNTSVSDWSNCYHDPSPSFSAAGNGGSPLHGLRSQVRKLFHWMTGLYAFDVGHIHLIIS